MPGYLPPQLTANCACRGFPMRAFMCMTGHMLECHFPLDCRTAGCGHLAKYDFEPEQVQELQEAADRLFAALADPECPHCGGKGFRSHQVNLAEMGVRDAPAEPVEMLGTCECIDLEELTKRGAT